MLEFYGDADVNPHCTRSTTMLRRILGAVLTCGSIAIGLTVMIIAAPAVSHAFPADFDGDGISDPTVFRPFNPAQGNWYVYPSSGGCPPQMTAIPGGGCYIQWGLSGDVPLTGDFDADGKADFTVWRPSNGSFYIRYSSFAGSVIVTPSDTPAFAQVGDIPDEADINGDGRSELLVFRPSIKKYYWRTYTGGSLIVEVSNSMNLINTTMYEPFETVSANYRNTSIRPEPFVLSRSRDSGSGLYQLYWLGVQTDSSLPNIIVPHGEYAASASPLFDDKPLVGNYGGVAAYLADYVRWRPSTQQFFISWNGGGMANATFNWGLAGDVPVGGDFNGDGFSDPAVFRSSEGGTQQARWYVKSYSWTDPNCQSPGLYINYEKAIDPGTGATVGCWLNWGLTGDIPVY